jgi:hypothetical protein
MGFLGSLKHTFGKVGKTISRPVHTISHAGSKVVKGVTHEVKSQISAVHSLENSVVGGVKGLSGLMSSPIFLIAGAGIVGLIVFKK